MPSKLIFYRLLSYFINKGYSQKDVAEKILKCSEKTLSSNMTARRRFPLYRAKLLMKTFHIREENFQAIFYEPYDDYHKKN